MNDDFVRTGSKMGISPLMLSAMNGHTVAVKLLLDMGSDINAQVSTRLSLKHSSTSCMFTCMSVVAFIVPCCESHSE